MSYFTLFQITILQLNNPEIHSAIKEVQDSCVEYDPGLRRFCEPPTKSHITLLVINVQEKELAMARMIIVKTLREKVLKQAGDPPLTLII